MAGIGFQLKGLFGRESLSSRIKAVMYASLVTVGPMICCMVGMAAVFLLMTGGETPFLERELYQASTSYAFAFSFMITSPVSLFLTRSLSDRLYNRDYDALLPIFYGGLQATLILAAIPALALLIFSDLTPGLKVALIMLYMSLTIIWIEVIFISAMKAYRQVALAFFIGMFIAVGVIYLLIQLGLATALYMLVAMALGFIVTACMLLWQIERFFRTPTQSPSMGFLRDLRRYPSLLAIGLFTGLGMFEHQIAQWLMNGEWAGGTHTFRVSPMYDVSVYYAILSILPTLVWFVVSVETTFYPKFRMYYDYILGHGTISDIDRSRKEMEQTLISELAKLMGIQLAFSIFSIACGVQFLPYIGFTAQQVDTFNILVMAFYAYVMVSILLLLLLYFDDRRGALTISAAFLALNIICSLLFRAEEFQGLSLFAASFPVLIAALWRLLYRIRTLHYVTFSAQPLVVRNQE